jgi:hypothetical protein
VGAILVPPDNVLTIGRPGDLDGDGDVDLVDFSTFGVCFTSPGQQGPPYGCTPQDFFQADLDLDGDVDLVDFSTFAAAFTGPDAN